MAMPPKRKSSAGTKTPKRFKGDSAGDPEKVKSKVKSKNLSKDIFSLRECIKDASWETRLKPLFEKEYSKNIEELLTADYGAKKEIFPPKEMIFNALNLVPFEKVTVVILGQDPYHDNGQAHGLSFSVPKRVGIPPSLKNIYKELASDIKGFSIPDHGCLEKWASQGILLLNATLTVQAHNPNSHAKYGWQKFTDDVIRLISDDRDGVVFILWGGFAHKKEKLIDGNKHCILKTAHPSPLSFNKFFGCKCFSKTNDALKRFGSKPIDWSL